MSKQLSSLRIKIFADGADKAGIFSLYKNPLIQGITTNPTLMHKADIKDYEGFARDILKSVKNKPISFEVFSDDFDEMRRQALKIAAWQKNVYVKIPITNTKGELSIPLIRELSQKGVRLNITAILTLKQVLAVSRALNPAVPSVVSVFAGRIADTGVNPISIMKKSLKILKQQSKAELLWASVREVLNIFQADECGCHIVTVPHDILNKAVKLTGTDLNVLSLDTVKMFRRDATDAGFSL
jgi:transaldolase